MIFKAKVIANAIRLIGHLNKVRDSSRPETANWNDKVSVVCTYNLFAGSDLKAAAMEMAAVATGSRAKKPYFTVAINPDRPEGMALSDEEAEYVAKRLMKELGFSDEHQWFLVRHEKLGRVHYHLVVNRIDLVTLKAVHLSWNYPKQEKVARSMERFFGLPTVPGAFADRPLCPDGRLGGTRPARRKRNHKEEQQAERTATPIQTVDTDLAWAWANSNCGAEFRLRLQERGYQLAKGDRREWVILDSTGGIHSPARRLRIRIAELRERTRDLDKIEFLSIDALRAKLSQADQVIDEPVSELKKNTEKTTKI